MNVIMSITDHAIPHSRASRDFRAKYPDDVLLEQINGILNNIISLIASTWKGHSSIDNKNFKACRF